MEESNYFVFANDSCSSVSVIIFLKYINDAYSRLNCLVNRQFNLCTPFKVS